MRVRRCALCYDALPPNSPAHKRFCGRRCQVHYYNNSGARPADDKVGLFIRVDPELAERLSARAVELNTTRTALARQLIVDGIGG